jgi:glycosyltransferase involved in cell wall biosynthesis
VNVLVVPAIDWLAGPENRLHRIFHRIAKKHSVHCVYLDTGSPKLRHERLIVLHRPRTIRTTSLPLFHTLNVLPQYNLVKSLIRKQNIDVLVTTNLFGGTASIHAAKVLRIPAVYDYVDYMPFFVEHIRGPYFCKAPLRTILEQMNEYNLRTSDLVLAIGMLLCRHARRFNTNVVYLPNGASTDAFVPQAVNPDLQQRLGLTGYVIGYVGYIQFWTDFRPVLEGFRGTLKEYPDAKLLIVGTGPKLKALKRQIRELEISSSVILPGYVPYSMLPQYVSAMDICVLPFAPSFGTHSITPMKIHEYAAMAKPIVTTPLYEVTRSYRDAILVAETAEEYKEAFLRLLGNPRLRAQKGRSARRIVEQNFNWDKLAAAYEQQLARIVMTGS